jgi:hypothetical protein
MFFLFFLRPLILRWLAAVLPQLYRHFTAFFTSSIKKKNKKKRKSDPLLLRMQQL